MCVGAREHPAQRCKALGFTVSGSKTEQTALQAGRGNPGQKVVPFLLLPGWTIVYAPLEWREGQGKTHDQTGNWN